MPPTSLLCSHQPAISTLNNVPNPDPNFSDPSTSIFALSSLRKLLLPGTLRIGPISHVGTFFVDCGADDVFMDSKLAEELKVPLTKLSNPIMLRLADGDSSSTLTHRTVPLQLHIGKHVETVSFYVTSLCHGLITWDTPGWKSIIPGLIGFRGWSTLTRLTVWRTVRLGQLGLRDLENLQQSTKSCL
ncbi:hypothetical protein BASA81_017610 [Batrachochytrium salamandrivorans]|nr:hypothetical protein BASA81_017610 [Batrachochytrium salamandrivorans]